MCKLCTLKIEFWKLSPLCMQLYFMHNMSQTSWWYRLQNCDALFSRGFKFVKTKILHFWCTAFHSLHSFSVWTPWKAPPFLSWRQCDPLEGMSSVFCLLSSSPPSLSTPSPSSTPSPPSSPPLSPSPPPSLSSYPPILTALQPSGFRLDLFVHFDVTHTGRCISKHQSSIEASWRQFQRRWGENISTDKI